VNPFEQAGFVLRRQRVPDADCLELSAESLDFECFALVVVPPV
jgi:hypothetical protein